MKWQPISTAPKDGTEILLIEFGVSEKFEVIRGQPDYGCWGSYKEDFGPWGEGILLSGWMTDYGHIENPTHWMPKPEDPDNLIDKHFDL